MLGIRTGPLDGASAVQKASMVAERICIARLEAWYRAKHAHCFSSCKIRQGVVTCAGIDAGPLLGVFAILHLAGLRAGSCYAWHSTNPYMTRLRLQAKCSGYDEASSSLP